MTYSLLNIVMDFFPPLFSWNVCRNAEQEDQGLYECQVSTVPKLSKVVLLHVKGRINGIIPFKAERRKRRIWDVPSLVSAVGEAVSSHVNSRNLD